MPLNPFAPPAGLSSSDSATGAAFRTALLGWHRRDNDRTMPWKGEKDPYRIWLSEVILQQTRVEQGWKYYENFIAAFPRVEDLAVAPEEQVYKLWEGLGYYSRCTNLIRAARLVANEHKGVFPDTYEGILALPGVGPYTAAAIASFAFNLPHAVLDGNVYRVLSRIYNNDTPTDTTAGKKAFTFLAGATLDVHAPALYNQAIMDFGATVCKPVPRCAECFFQHDCRSRLAGRQDELPVRVKKTRVRERWFHYFLISYGNEVLVHQRTAGDIWSQLWEFYLIETEKEMPAPAVLRLFREQLKIDVVPGPQHEVKQRLSHQLIYFRLQELQAKERVDVPGFRWTDPNGLRALALPKTLRSFLSDEPGEALTGRQFD